ncbi:uncharacterized protein [Apostichopus japonicus]|uniref:uncharacterized protein n=1 Tax=Stichopus japonicus TaxID=307972 RepID=UPI003AB7FC92
MARIIICCLVICLAVLFSEACHPYDSHPQGVPGRFAAYRLSHDQGVDTDVPDLSTAHRLEHDLVVDLDSRLAEFRVDHDLGFDTDVLGRLESYRGVPSLGFGTETPRPKYYPESGLIDLTTDFTITRGRPTPPASGSWWFRDRRDVDSQKDSIFKMIDMNGNQYIEICEWVKEGGSALNFVAFLSDDDTDGDEKISWQEFQAVNV